MSSIVSTKLVRGTTLLLSLGSTENSQRKLFSLSSITSTRSNHKTSQPHKRPTAVIQKRCASKRRTATLDTCRLVSSFFAIDIALGVSYQNCKTLWLGSKSKKARFAKALPQTEEGSIRCRVLTLESCVTPVDTCRMKARLMATPQRCSSFMCCEKVQLKRKENLVMSDKEKV
jgi:hypothetical protein